MFYLEQYGKRDPFQNALLVPSELLLKAGNNVYILFCREVWAGFAYALPEEWILCLCPKPSSSHVCSVLGLCWWALLPVATHLLAEQFACTTGFLPPGEHEACSESRVFPSSFACLCCLEPNFVANAHYKVLFLFIQRHGDFSPGHHWQFWQFCGLWEVHSGCGHWSCWEQKVPSRKSSMIFLCSISQRMGPCLIFALVFATLKSSVLLLTAAMKL